MKSLTLYGAWLEEPKRVKLMESRLKCQIGG